MSIKFLPIWRSGKFVHAGGTWVKSFNSGTDLIRTSTFTSKTKGSLIKSFDLFGYKNGGLEIQLNYHVDTIYMGDSEICSFLADLGCQTTLEHHCAGIYSSKTMKQTKTLMEMLILNNEIEENTNFNEFTRDLEFGACTNDRGLTEEEEQDLNAWFVVMGGISLVVVAYVFLFRRH